MINEKKITKYLLRILQILYRAIGKRTILTRYGVSMIANWGDTTFEYALLGDYGFKFSEYLNKLDFDFIFLDIGANQGLYSLIAAKNENLVKAYAFEPVPQIGSRLLSNIKINQFCDKIENVQAAISNKTGLAHIYFRESHSGRSTMNTPLPSNDAEKVEISTIDYTVLNEIVKSRGIPIVVKIDVEGHEKEVLEQLYKSDLRANMVAFFVEINLDRLDGESIYSYFPAEEFSAEKVGSGRQFDVLFERKL